MTSSNKVYKYEDTHGLHSFGYLNSNCVWLYGPYIYSRFTVKTCEQDEVTERYVSVGENRSVSCQG